MHLCGVLLSRDVAPEDAEALLIDAWSQADAELADRAPQEVPNTLSTTAAALENEHATGVPQMERITPGLFEELERIFRWRLGVHSPNGRKLLLEDSPVPSSNNNEIKWFYELGDPKPREFLIADACVKGYPVVCYGAGGTAKSFAVLAAGVAIASASGCDEWLGIKVLEHGYALYLDFELDVEEQHRRVRDLCNGLGVPIPKRLAYLSAVGLTTEEAMAKARAFIQKYNAVAIILDSMGLAMGGDMDKAKDVIKFYRQYVDPLRNLGATPFIVDHEGKLQPGERHKDKAPIGSAYKGWLGRSLFQFLLEEYDKDNSTMKIRVRQHKTNFTPIRPFGVEFHFEAEKVSMTSYDLTDQALADEDIIPGKQRILGVLEVEDATRAEIVTATGLSDATVRGYLAELRREGKIGDKGYRGRELVYTLLEDGPKETDNNKEEF
jgi:hypothetical protein